MSRYSKDANGNWHLIAGTGNSAEDITYDNTTSGLTSDNVQDAIDEILELPPRYSNPNLLDNPWFTVNQRGENSYSAYAYTVDRWRNASSAGVTTISPTSDGITIVNNHETSRGYFYQYFEDMLPAGETYTLSVKSTQTKRWVLQVRYDDGGTKSYAGINIDSTSPEIMQYTFTATKPIDAILIETQAQSTTNNRAVKFEKGPYSTLSLDTAPN